MSEGIVYVLTNPAMPGLVIFQVTCQAISLNEENGDMRLPGFRCVYAGKVRRKSEVMRHFNDCFGMHRVDSRGSLYSITRKQAISLLSLFVLEKIDPEQLLTDRSTKFEKSDIETEIDLDGDKHLLRNLLDGTAVDEDSLLDAYSHEHEDEAQTRWSETVLKWMKEDEARSLKYHSKYKERNLSIESTSVDPYFEDTQNRAWEEKEGYFRHEKIGDRSTDDIDASDHEYYETLYEDRETEALAEEESYFEQMLANELLEPFVDKDEFTTDPGRPFEKDDPHLDGPYYSWEAEDYEEQKRQLSED